jgi:hypothetical protein
VSCDSSAVAWSSIGLVLVFMFGARRCRSSILLYSTWKRRLDVPTSRCRQIAEGLDGGPTRPAGNAMATPPHTAKSLDVLPISAKFTDRLARAQIRHVKGLCEYVKEGLSGSYYNFATMAGISFHAWPSVKCERVCQQEEFLDLCVDRMLNVIELRNPSAAACRYAQAISSL